MRGLLTRGRSIVACTLLLAVSGGKGGAATVDPLQFPKDHFELKTISVQMPDGKKTVVYRLYEHLAYVSKPVDRNYQSLDVKVPVSVNGIAVDARRAPILFEVNVGGYMSAPNIRTASMRMPGPPPGFPSGGTGGPPGARPSGRGGPPGGFLGAGPGNKDDVGLASGFVIVSPGARGRDNKAPDGTYYGKAPAAIVDLKAAVRYIRHNRGLLPGNSDWIVSTGCSAGGALSALLAASGNSPLYEPYEKAIGAAEEADNIFAAGCGSPVTDLDHGDFSYEWAFGASEPRTGTIDRTVSDELKDRFKSYQASLGFSGNNGYGGVTADNLGEYMVTRYLAPSAGAFLMGLSAEKREAYLRQNPWLHWDGRKASFTYAEFAARHVTRFKGAPAFSAFDLSAPETNLFGDEHTDSRLFTDYSLQHVTKDASALRKTVDLMNPMYFIRQRNPGAAQHWWIHHGAIETDSAPTNAVNLTLGLENMGRDVHMALYWDAGHCEDLDPIGFITWIGKITGYHIRG